MSTLLRRSRAGVLVAALCLLFVRPSCAAISTIGNVTPDPNTTTSSDNLYIGDTAAGMMLVDAGSGVASRYSYVGHDAGVIGSAIVDGAGSTWTSSDKLYVGLSGAGALTVSGGAAVSNLDGYIGMNAGATGIATVDGSTWTNDGTLFIGAGSIPIGAGGEYAEPGDGTLNIMNGGLVEVASRTAIGSFGGQGTVHFDGGTLRTRTLQAAPGQLKGTGTVEAGGLVMDIDLVFDRHHGLQQQLTLASQPDQHVTVDLDVDASSVMGAGYKGEGSLTITDGLTVSTWSGQLGYLAGSSGTASVDGPGSSWNPVMLTVGEHGNGTLTITNGATVDSGSTAYVGRFTGASGAVTVDGAGSSWTSGARYIGYDGDGVMVVSGGAHVTDNGAFLGYRSGSSGTALVSGAGSTWTTGGLNVGSGGGIGTLNVSGGGQVNGGSGGVSWESEATIRGPGSAWSLTGTLRNSGMLTVSGSAELHSEDASLNGGPDGPGRVTIDGPGSSWTNVDTLVVGEYGFGVLNITYGAQVSSGSGWLAYDEWFPGTEYEPIGMVTVDGVGSTWTNTGELFVGGYGDATLAISGGGLVSNGDASIAAASGTYFRGTGTVTVTGPGSTWTNNGKVNVGHYGDGILSITDGATVTCTRGYVGKASGSTGIVTLDGAGSGWTISGELLVGDDGDGTLDLISGGIVDVSGRVRLADGSDAVAAVNLAGGVLRMHGGMLTRGSGAATFSFTAGRLEGAGTVSLGAPLLQNGGTLAPGNSAGMTTIEGGYTLDGGAIEIEIDGLGSAGVDWDLVDVNGAVDLVGGNGLLDAMLDVILGFAPSLGNDFLVLDNDGTDLIVGMFANGTAVRAPYEGNLYQFAIDYAAGDGNDISLITQAVGLWGDYNGDGTVDAADYTVWRDALGAAVAPYFGADGNGDGTVNEADHAVWKAHFGASAGSGAGATGSASATAPEPASLVLSALAAVALWLRQRRCGR